MRYLKYGALALVAVVLAGLAFVIVSDRLAQPAAPDPATLIAKAAHYDVRIVRDNFGVPHVFGHRDADVAFGLGFAHSEDDFATIQDVALATPRPARGDGRAQGGADRLCRPSAARVGNGQRALREGSARRCARGLRKPMPTA